jgi:UDP-glucose 4-epimerase
MVIPRFINAALENKPINIFGDGLQSRVFCHVIDSVRAIITLASDKKMIGEVFNIGGLGEISILNLAKLIIERTGSKSDIDFISYDDAYAVGYEDMARRVPDINKLTSFTGWAPKLDIKTIIDDTIKSYS